MRYPGSKKRLAGKICKHMKEVVKKTGFTPTAFYDLMTGGGNMAMAALKCFPGLPVIINDIDRKLIVYFRKLRKEPADAILTILSRPRTKEDYLQMKKLCRENEAPDWLCFWYRHTLAYGSAMWGGYSPNGGRLRIELLLSLLLDDIFLARQVTGIYNYSYENFSLLSNTIIYLDPPYVGTDQPYAHKWTNEDRIKMYEWAEQMSNSNLVFISDGDLPPIGGWHVLDATSLQAAPGTKNKTGKTKRFNNYLFIAEKWIKEVQP